MMKSGLILSVLMLYLASGVSAAVPELETLPNGLEVIWFPDSKLPLIDLTLIVKSGSRDDLSGKSGTVEYLARALDRAAEIEALGAELSVTPEEEFITIGLHGLAMDAPALLKSLSKTVIHPKLSSPEVLRHSSNILERWAQMANSGELLLNLASRRQSASGTAYGRGTIYSAEEFKKITPADLISFHQTHFTPKNASLLIVGRADRAQLRQELMKSFGPWSGEAPSRVVKSFTDNRIPPIKSGGVLIVNRPGLQQAQVRIGFRAPSFNHPDQYALAVVNALFGEYFDSRLNVLLRDKLGLTYAIASGFIFNRELGVFNISAGTRNASVGPLLRKTLEALHLLRSGTITDQEIQTAKDYLAGGFPLQIATLNSFASRWTVGHLLGLDSEFLSQFVPKIQAVTRVDIERVVKAHFSPPKIYLAAVGDAKEIQKSLTEQGGFTSKVITEKDLF